jgi:hypothetical protein
MFDKEELWRQIKTVLSAMDFRRSMMVLIALLVFIPNIWGVVSGGFKKGFEESMRDSDRRMSRMSKLLAKLEKDGDEFDVVYKSSKSGQAYIDVRFLRSEWDRSAGNDLVGALDKQGWSRNERNGVTCLDDATMSISGGESYVRVVMDYSNASIALCSP